MSRASPFALFAISSSTISIGDHGSRIDRVQSIEWSGASRRPGVARVSIGRKKASVSPVNYVPPAARASISRRENIDASRRGSRSARKYSSRRDIIPSTAARYRCSIICAIIRSRARKTSDSRDASDRDASHRSLSR